MQNLPFVTSYQRRTDELNCLILAVSMFLSNEGASKVLGLLGVTISNDSIKRVLDKIVIEDHCDVERIGIDDVAMRKGQTYATAVYDMEDHHLIALLDGRDKETVTEWLESHKKIKIATRDRASAYASAINEVLPECIQIADRFHLLQNLIDRMKEIFKEEIPEMIFIKDGKIMDETPKKETMVKINPASNELSQLNYDNSEPIDKSGNIIAFDKSCTDKNNKAHQKHAENRKKKQKLIRDIQKRWNELDKKRYKTIMAEFELSQLTVKKYINMGEQEIQEMDNPTVYKTRDKPTNNYVNIIYKMYMDKIKPEIIFSYVLKLGFDGSWRTLGNQIELILKNNFGIILPINWYLKYEYSPEIIVIKRNEVLKYITTKDEKKKRNKKVELNIEIIRERYLVIRELEEVYNCFYSTLMGDDPNHLYVFIEKYRDSKLNGFIKGIEKDIAPIKNAISYPYSSGFVEGNNNKFKLIKRILYGRSNLVNLFRKCYLTFLMNNIDFNLFDLLKR